ncbi:VENN motif pre-toxin domain-containing protein, partial [Pectobacterium odoriferum]
FQRAAQAATAAIQALAGGDIQKAIASGASPYLAQLVKDVTIPKDESKITASDIAANAMAHAVVGAVVAQLSGQDAAAGAIGASSGELIARAIMAKVYPGKTTNDLTEEEKQSVSALSTLASGLVSGLASNSTASAASGAQSGRNAVENNALSSKDEKQRQDAKWSLPYLEGEKKAQAEQLVANLDAKDGAFDAAIDAACKNLSSAACQGMRQELAAMAKSYDEQLDGQYIGTMASIYKEGKGQVDGLMWQYASADATAEREANVSRIAENWGVSKETADILYTSMAGIHTAAAIGGAFYGMKGPSTVTVYRVEGTPNTRLLIGENGQVTITGSTTLYLNFGDKARALEFFEKRSIQNMDNTSIKTFEVPNSVLDDLRKTAVKESVARLPENKGKPVIADPTKAKDQYGIRPEKLKELQDKIIQGTGKDANK